VGFLALELAENGNIFSNIDKFYGSEELIRTYYH